MFLDSNRLGRNHWRPKWSSRKCSKCQGKCWRFLLPVIVIICKQGAYLLYQKWWWVFELHRWGLSPLHPQFQNWILSWQVLLLPALSTLCFAVLKVSRLYLNDVAKQKASWEWELYKIWRPLLKTDSSKLWELGQENAYRCEVVTKIICMREQKLDTTALRRCTG